MATYSDITRDGAVLLISCYELGHQPLGLVQPAAYLRRAGFAPELVDVDVEPLDDARLTRARLVGISVPMHTALRIGIGVARRVRTVNPDCHIAFYGTYAALNAEYLLDTVADSCFGAEFELPMVELARTLERPDASQTASPPSTARELTSARMSKGEAPAPSRKGAAPLERYTRLVRNATPHLAGYVAASRGCKHRCEHCPLPSVYDGTFYALPRNVVLEDIRGLVADGAEHITFADPDFLNGPEHARRIAREMHNEFPALTFDFTAKIEHLLEHRPLVAEMKRYGCVFVVSAIETLSAQTLKVLAKGHTPDEAVETIRFFKSIGLALRPTLVPFTPWDTLDDYWALLRMVEREELVDFIDPVQYSVRLLVPPGSLLLSSDAMRPYLSGLDQAKFTYDWTHPDPTMDALHEIVTSLVATATRSNEDPALTFYRIKARTESAIYRTGYEEPDEDRIRIQYPPARERPPRLTESWFC